MQVKGRLRRHLRTNSRLWNKLQRQFSMSSVQRRHLMFQSITRRTLSWFAPSRSCLIAGKINIITHLCTSFRLSHRRRTRSKRDWQLLTLVTSWTERSTSNTWLAGIPWRWIRWQKLNKFARAPSILATASSTTSKSRSSSAAPRTVSARSRALSSRWVWSKVKFLFRRSTELWGAMAVTMGRNDHNGLTSMTWRYWSASNRQCSTR